MHRLEEFSPTELRRLELARDGFGTYLQLADAFQWGNPPAAGSPFASGTRENAGIWWREAGDLALAASFDHLLAFNTLIHGAVPRLAGYGVLRGCVEAAAIAWWLFDPNAPEQDRVQRGFEERLHSIYGRRRLVEPENMPRHDAARAAVVAAAAQHGLTEQPDSRTEGRVTHFGHPRPDTHALLVRMLPGKPPKSKVTDGEYLWRTLSAFAHSELWTSTAGLREVEDDTKPRILVVNLDTLLGAAWLTLRAHDSAFSRRMAMAGHSTWEQRRGPLPNL